MARQRQAATTETVVPPAPPEPVVPQAAEVPPAPAAPEPPAPEGRKLTKRQELLVEWVRHREEGKAHYEAADLALGMLAKKMKPGQKVKHPVTEEEFTLTDNFAEGKNVSFGIVGVRRYELKAVRGTKKTPLPEANGEAGA